MTPIEPAKDAPSDSATPFAPSAAFAKQYAETQMRALDNSREVSVREKIIDELFSPTFLRGVEELAIQARIELGNKLLRAANEPAASASFSPWQFAVTALAAHVAGNRSELVDACDAYTRGFIFAELPEQPSDNQSTILLQRLSLPCTARLTQSIYPHDSLERMFTSIDAAGSVLFSSEPDRSELLEKFPVLRQDVARVMQTLLEQWQHWLSLGWNERAGRVAEVASSLETLMGSRRVKMFYKLVELGGTAHSTIPLLKESFLTTLAVTLREILRSTPSNYPLVYHHPLHALARAVQHEFFFVEGAGVVMDRWLDRQLARYEELLISRCKTLYDGSVVLRSEFCLAVKKALGSSLEESSAPLPFTNSIDSLLVGFANKRLGGEGKISRFPRGAITTKAAEEILKMIPEIVTVEFDDFESPIAVLKNEKKEISDISPTPIENVPQPISQDLVDLLLAEVVACIPRGVLAHKEPPVRVRAGVYKIAGREVAMSSRAGVLVVGAEEGVVWLSKEYGVPVATLRRGAKAALQVSAAFPGSSAENKSQTAWATSRGAVNLSSTAASAPALAKKTLDLADPIFLYKLIVHGIKLDEYWKGLWSSFVVADRLPDPHPKNQKEVGSLKRFVELNISYALRKDWAKGLLYDDILGPQSGLANSAFAESDDDLLIVPTGGVPSTTSSASLSPSPMPDFDASEPFYKTRKCIAFQAGKCTRGTTCTYAHSEAELRDGPVFRPPGDRPATVNSNPFYKTKMCSSFLEGTCNKGDTCGFAHSGEELAFYTAAAKASGFSVPATGTTPPVNSAMSNLSEIAKKMVRERSRSPGRVKGGSTVGVPVKQQAPPPPRPIKKSLVTIEDEDI